MTVSCLVEFAGCNIELWGNPRGKRVVLMSTTSGAWGIVRFEKGIQPRACIRTCKYPGVFECSFEQFAVAQLGQLQQLQQLQQLLLQLSPGAAHLVVPFCPAFPRAISRDQKAQIIRADYSSCPSRRKTSLQALPSSTETKGFCHGVSDALPLHSLNCSHLVHHREPDN